MAKAFSKYYSTVKGRATHGINNARRRAEALNVEFDLTHEWMAKRLETGICEVTGIPFVLRGNGGKAHIQNSFSPSIDRIDQNGGYTVANCRLVVWIYNRARGAFPDADFTVLVKALAPKLA